MTPRGASARAPRRADARRRPRAPDTTLATLTLSPTTPCVTDGRGQPAVYEDLNRIRSRASQPHALDTSTTPGRIHRTFPQGTLAQALVDAMRVPRRVLGLRGGARKTRLDRGHDAGGEDSAVRGTECEPGFKQNYYTVTPDTSHQPVGFTSREAFNDLVPGFGVQPEFRFSRRAFARPQPQVGSWTATCCYTSDSRMSASLVRTYLGAETNIPRVAGLRRPRPGLRAAVR